jgi:hypothetical protein
MPQRFSSVPAFAASILALLSLVAAPARAREYIIDQQRSLSIYGSYSIKGGAPVGQEFVPSHGVLNVAGVHVLNGTMSDGAPADLQADDAEGRQGRRMPRRERHPGGPPL